MPINPFMNPGGLIGSPGEQQLLDDLIVESIQVHGLSVLYLPRTEVKMDLVYLEDPLVRFDKVVEIEVYLRSFDQFEGDGDQMMNWGVDIRDQVVFSMSRTRFQQEMGLGTEHGFERPREGDLIWYPLNQKLFEIRYVNKFQMHYPLGTLFLWELKCELLEYSNQVIETGVPEIDRIMELSQVEGAGGRPDPLDDSERIADEVEPLLDFDELDVFTEGRYGVRGDD